MSVQPSFNRTRNSTGRPGFGNRSNVSNVGNDRDNSTWLAGDPPRDTPEVLFYLLSVMAVPAMIGCVFLFYNFVRLPHLRAKSSNLLIICLLTINFAHVWVDLPFRLYYLFEGEVPFSNSLFCLFWTWSDSILTALDLFIMAMASIERYLFIFHHVFLHSHPRLLCQLPIMLCLVIPTTWYTVLIFGYPCQQIFTRSTLQCGTSCYLASSAVFGNTENVLFFMFPLFIIVIGNGTLIVRVLIQKKSMKRKRRLRLWRKNLRMISQLMFIAVLYMGIYVPSCILLIFGSYVRRTRFQPWAVAIRTRYFTHLKYLVIFGCPFVILAGQKEMHPMITNLFVRAKCRRTQQWKTRIHALSVIPTQNRREND